MCIINPRHACAARVTIVGLSVCVRSQHLTSGASVCLSHTQRAAKVIIIGGISLKPLRCRDPALFALYSYLASAMKNAHVLVYMLHSLMPRPHART